MAERQDEDKFRRDQKKYGHLAEQTTVFLALYMVLLGILFLTRGREQLLKQEILTGLGAVLNISVAVLSGMREKWPFSVIAMTAAAAALFVLGLQIRA